LIFLRLPAVRPRSGVSQVARPRPPSFDSVDAPPAGFWAVTTYFNPAGFRLKLDNYRIFRRHLSLPLLTVELSSGAPFELRPEDADILVQLHGGDVLWQKERLLNRAVEALPAGCTRVAWIDCDVVFEHSGWVEATSRLLDRAPLVQPFSELWIMPRGWRPGGALPSPLTTRPSTAQWIASGLPVEGFLGPDFGTLSAAHGTAWAASRQFLERHPLYDVCVIGGGDRAFCAAVFGILEGTMTRFHMSPRRRRHFGDWADGLHDAVRADVGWTRLVPGVGRPISRTSMDAFATISGRAARMARPFGWARISRRRSDLPPVACRQQGRRGGV
jgi:hypothetical protein